MTKAGIRYFALPVALKYKTHGRGLDEMVMREVDLKRDRWFERITDQFAGKLVDIRFYKSTSGKRPYCEWFRSLDASVKFRVMQRLDRVSMGNFGDFSPFAEGVWELRLDFGPGYRIYYGNLSDNVIGLLYAGDKSTQSRDGYKAVAAWKAYRRKT